MSVQAWGFAIGSTIHAAAAAAAKPRLNETGRASFHRAHQGTAWQRQQRLGSNEPVLHRS